jgi:hypothetical protein
MNWISVNDRLPDDDTTVLVYCGDENEPIWLAYCEDQEWFWVTGKRCYPTHWAELPEPPEE